MSKQKLANYTDSANFYFTKEQQRNLKEQNIYLLFLSVITGVYITLTTLFSLQF